MRRFTFLHEAGHVKALCSGEASNEKLAEILADTYALASLTRPTEKKNFLDHAHEFFLEEKPSSYLTPSELLQHGKKLLNIQKKENKLSVLAYARGILADRQMGGYEQRLILQGVEFLLSIF